MRQCSSIWTNFNAERIALPSSIIEGSLLFAFRSRVPNLSCVPVSWKRNRVGDIESCMTYLNPFQANFDVEMDV